MNFQEYEKKFNEAEQKEICRVIGIINSHQVNSNPGQVKGIEMQVLFDYWHQIFPKQKQSIGCLGCRKAVYKFFSKLAEHLNNKMIEIG